MDVEALEASFLELPTAAVTGMERRAFGEFVGPQGEPASYAFGVDHRGGATRRRAVD